MDAPASKLTDLTFHLIVESAPSAVILVNQQGRIAYVNRQSEALFGYSAAQLIGQAVEILVPERLRDQHPGYRNEYVKSPSLRAMGAGRDLFARRRDGSEIPVEIGLNPVVLVDGTWVLATVIDITARKEAEDRFRDVVQSAPTAILIVDRHGSIQLANRQATLLFGYDEGEMLGNRVEMLLPERYRAAHPALLQGFFASPQTRYMGAGRDLTGLRKDGREIPIEIGLNPMHTAQGVVVLAAIVDITERKLQAEMRAKKEAAEAAYKAKGELLAIASHDLKNPLASISGLAQIMLEMKRGDPGAAQQDIEFLESIVEASAHMSDVVAGILETEGLEQRGITLSEERVDITMLCNDLLRIDEPVATKKNIRMIGHIAAGITARGDRTRLREAFDNYLSNSIKYSPPGKPVTVTLSLVAGGAQLEFGVQDEGPGLTDDDKKKLFGKFTRLSAKPTGGELSTGLGLSIVKSIIELHQGTVGCNSEYGHGTYFWARLPVK